MHIITWALAALFTLLSLLAHLTSPSSMHQPEANWQTRVEYHQTHPAFVVRPITTGIIVFMHDSLGLGYRTSFFTLQFLLMLLCGPVLVRYLRVLGFSIIMSLAGMTIFYFSLPVFMAHFDPLYTWSDFWVYLMVPLSFAFLIRKKYIPAVLAMAWALWARETSLLFLPPWFLFIYRSERERVVPSLLLTIAPAVLWLVLRAFLTGTAGGDIEFKLAFNFDGFLRSRDTIFSLLVSLGMMWPIGFYQILRGRGDGISRYEPIRFGAVFTALGFVLSTLLFAQARETRLFFPPFVFFLPLTLVFFQGQRLVFIRLWNKYRFPIIAMTGLIIIAVSLMMASLLFPEFDFRTWKDGNRAFLGLHLAATIIFVLFLFIRNRGAESQVH